VVIIGNKEKKKCSLLSQGGDTKDLLYPPEVRNTACDYTIYTDEKKNTKSQTVLTTTTTTITTTTSTTITKEPLIDLSDPTDLNPTDRDPTYFSDTSQSEELSDHNEKYLGIKKNGIHLHSAVVHPDDNSRSE